MLKEERDFKLYKWHPFGRDFSVCKTPGRKCYIKPKKRMSCRTEVSSFSVQFLSHVWLFATPWTVACQDSLSIANSQSLLKLMSIKLLMSSNHLLLCHSFLLSPSIFPSSRVFSNESVLHIRWQKYWSFSFSISPSNEYSGLISFRIDWFVLFAVPESSPASQLESINSLALSLLYVPTLTSVRDY